MLKRIREYNMLVGFYGVWTIVTYLAVVSGSIGIYFGLQGRTDIALICLMLSALCDAIDGTIARACKKRTEKEKDYGRQLDSLCDTVSFIFLPIAIFYGLGYTNWYNILIYTLYTLAGVIRLAYFNVIAEKTSVGAVKTYSGMPVPVTAVIFPLVYLIKHSVIPETFHVIYTYTMLMIAVLFVLNFKIKKPKNTYIFIFLAFAVILTIIILYIGKR